MAGIGNIDGALLLQNTQSDGLLKSAEHAASKSRYSSKEEDGIRAQSKQFESMLVKMMIDSMRKNVPEDELLEDESDPSRGIYQGMLDGEYAQLLSNKESFGLAESMMRQFGVEPGQGDENQSALAMMLGPTSHRPASQSSLFISPVSGPISSPFGVRSDPISGAQSEHSGLDIAVPSGQTVRAAASGVVIFAGERAGYGKLVEIDHQNGTRTRYGHLSAVGVEVGQHLKGGEELGKSGNTGRSTGPHLHFEVRVDGVAVDPSSFIRGR